MNFSCFNIDLFDTAQNFIKKADADVPFNQNDLKLDPNKHQTLCGYNKKYGGLCDLICNKILIDDLLGNQDLNKLKDKVTVETLDELRIKQSHLLDNHSFIEKMIGIFFGIYPNNILSITDQWSLLDSSLKVNSLILMKGLEDNVPDGETLKLEVFNRKFILIGNDQVGHSMLIKKISNGNYIFFDPNSGEYRNLSLFELGKKIDLEIRRSDSNDILIMRGKDYLNKLL